MLLNTFILKELYIEILNQKNIIINEKFHLKLIDFATSYCIGKYFDLKEKKKFVEGEVSKNTFVGTAEYISPEMVEQDGCSYTADLWALGCIIYEFFHAKSPFHHTSNFQILDKIKKHEMNPISEDIPEDVRDIIQKLLIYDPKLRIGASAKDKKQYDLKEIKSHRFFKGLDFDNLENLDPPVKLNSLCFIQTPNTNCSSDKNHSPLDIEIGVGKLDPDSFNINMNYFCEGNIKINGFNPNNLRRKSDSELNKHKVSPLDDSINNNNNNILLKELAKKKSPWFHYNTRLLILYQTKLAYYEPLKNIKKGEINLNKFCNALAKDDYKFELFTQKRTYYFKLENPKSKQWAEVINCLIEQMNS